MTSLAKARGYTLIELVVATGVAAIVVMGAVALLLAQERAFRSGTDDRALQETGRMALEEITTNLRGAGYGIDPAMAFDFGAMANARMDRAPPGLLVTVLGSSCATPALCRDSAAGPDELAFLSRNPFFNHTLVGAPTTTQLSLRGPLLAPLRRGQILQLACLSGALEWAYVTVGAEVAPSNAAQVDVALQSASGTDFPLQNAWLARTCFQSGPVTALKVDRFRYFIGTYTVLGDVRAWGTAGARPFLMLDQGLQTDAGSQLLTAVAADVEDLQVTYLFPGAQAPALGATPAVVGTQLVNGAGGIDLAPAIGSPGYATARGDPTRLTNHPANIRAVRVAVVVRSATPRPVPGSAADNLVPAAGNRAATAAPEQGYRHLLFETTTTPFNLDARTPYVPAISTTAGADNINVGGG